MIPFRIFDRENKQMWQVVNFHPDASTGGQYLLALEDDTGADGDLKLVDAKNIVSFKFVDFLDEGEAYHD